jgi:hypothetical protein
MKLVRLYANKLFKNIEFSETGLNIVLGRITNKAINDKDTHNLGKTLLCDLIDFMLLKKVDNKKEFFLTKNKIFAGCFFFLEISLDNGSYLVIRRSIDRPTKINFKESILPLDSFDININKWDFEELSFQTAVKQLNSYLNFNVVTDFSYRKYINYFLRHQADYLEVFHLSKYKGKNFLWKEFLIELFGYSNRLLQEKEQLETEITSKKSEITFLANRTITDGDKDSIKALIELKEQELCDRKKLINEIDFSKEDTDEHKKLVERIDAQLQVNNSELYALDRDIERISISLTHEIKQIDITELKAIFEETQVIFPNDVYIQFQDLLEFNKKLSSERNGYLKEQLIEMRKKLPEVKKNISNLQAERKNALSFLTETDSFEKYKEIQERISDIEVQINSLRTQYDKITGYQSEIQNLNEEIAALTVKKTNIIADIARMLQEGKHASIRNIFNEIIKDVLNVNGIISLNLNNSGNIEFEAKIQNPKTLSMTSKDNGASYKKLLCIAFDLSLMINYHNESFFKFAYHDGALEALDDRKKILFINTSRELCTQYGLQHIITLIDSDLPHNTDGSIFEFKEEEICLTLSDKDASDKLFTIDF